VNSSQKTLGEEIEVCNSIVTESREVGIEFLSTDKFLGCDNVGVENLEEPVLNDDSIGGIDVDDILNLSCGSNELSPRCNHRTTTP